MTARGTVVKQIKMQILILIFLFAISVIVVIYAFRIFKEWRKDNPRISAFQTSMFFLGIILIILSFTLILNYVEPKLKIIAMMGITQSDEMRTIAHGLKRLPTLSLLLSGSGFFLIILGVAKKNK